MVYPDSVSGSDQVSFAYNRQGELTALTDQNGTVHSYDYDLLGRRSQDKVTTLGSGVDSTVLRIATNYEVRGKVSGVTSYDNATVGSGNVVNDVQLRYDSFGNLTADYQSHAGAVNTSTTPVCLYGYAGGSGNTIRPTMLTYPNGRVLYYNYGVVGGTNDAVSRVGSLIDSDGATHLADYNYLGQAEVVEVAMPQPSLKYTLVGTAGGIDPDTGDIYWGLDRFDRVKDLLWYNTATSATVEEVKHGYDRAGNRMWRANLADTAGVHDELYAYDGLDRLARLDRGTLNSPETSLTARTFGQCWTLDSTGNWSGFRQDSTGGGWDLVQSRAGNTANELTSIVNSVGATWTTPRYDAAGNMTTLPLASNPSQSYQAVFDAWNRLVSMASGSTVVAQFLYDGLARRVLKKSFVAGVLKETRHFYHSISWQVLEEHVGSSSTAQRQFVWGQCHLDNLVLRDRDTSGDGILDERLFAVQDVNENVTLLVDHAGVVQERYAFDAYGMVAVLTPTFGPRASSLYSWEVLYAGYRWESECQLYHIRCRDYHPTLGSWLQRDLLGYEAGDWNLYRYVGNRPTVLTDPTGLVPPLIVVGVLAVGVLLVYSGGPVPPLPPAQTSLALATTVTTKPAPPPIKIILCVIGGILVLAAIAKLLTEGGPQGGPPPQPPEPQPPEQPNTCAGQHPELVLCSRLGPAYQFPNPGAACRAKYPDTKAVNPRPSDEGPCVGSGGMHYRCQKGSKFMGTASCCPCCADTRTGPVTDTRCRNH